MQKIFRNYDALMGKFIKIMREKCGKVEYISHKIFFN